MSRIIRIYVKINSKKWISKIISIINRCTIIFRVNATPVLAAMASQLLSVHNDHWILTSSIAYAIAVHIIIYISATKYISWSWFIERDGERYEISEIKTGFNCVYNIIIFEHELIVEPVYILYVFLIYDDALKGMAGRSYGIVCQSTLSAHNWRFI